MDASKMGRFLQDATDMIKGRFDFEEKFSDYLVSDTRFENALKWINNTKAKLLLFWIELHRHTLKQSDLYNTPLNYAYELEHIMPQSWGAHWGFDEVPLLDENGNPLPYEKAAEIRKAAIYEIGNMTLLSSKLNRQLQNYSFVDKINGTVIGSKHRLGMKEFASLSVTKEVVNLDPPVWNEEKIRERTNRLIEEAKKLWPIT